MFHNWAWKQDKIFVSLAVRFLLSVCPQILNKKLSESTGLIWKWCGPTIPWMTWFFNEIDEFYRVFQKRGRKGRILFSLYVYNKQIKFFLSNSTCQIWKWICTHSSGDHLLRVLNIFRSAKIFIVCLYSGHFKKSFFTKALAPFEYNLAKYVPWLTLYWDHSRLF